MEATMAISKKRTFIPMTILFLFLFSTLCLNVGLGEEKTDEKEKVQSGTTETPEVLKRETFEKLPKGRDFLSILPLLPGINLEKLSDGLSVNGASGAENRYYIDGIDTTTFYTGESGMRVNFDFIESIGVPAGGISAEHAGSTGGVVHVVTRSGGNRFHGELSLYYDGSALNGSPRPTLRQNFFDYGSAEYVTYPEDEWSRIETGFTLGGPIIKDKLWFFAGFMPKFQTTTRNGNNWPLPDYKNYPSISEISTIFFGETHMSGSNVFDRKDTSFSGILKLTAQPSENLRMSLTGIMDYSKWKGELPPVDGTGNPLEEYAEIGFEYPVFSIGGTIDYTITPNFSLYVSAGYFRSNETELNGPDGALIRHVTSNADIPGIPPDLIAPGNWMNWAYWQKSSQITKNIQTRLTSTVDLSYSVDLLGRHQLKTGFQVTRIDIDKDAGCPFDYYRFYWLRNYERADGTVMPTTYGYVEVRDPLGVVIEDVGSTGFAVFLQDDWTIGDRLTLSLGLRAEKENIPAFTDGYDAPIQWDFGDKLAPRVGFSYDIFGDAGLTVFGSFGVYYDTMKMMMAESYFGGYKWISHYYDIVNWDWKTAFPDNSEHPQTGGLVGGSYFESRNWRGTIALENIQPDIKPFRKDEFTFGVRKSLGDTWTLGARFLHNYIVNTVEDIVILAPDGSNPYFVGNPGSDWIREKFNESISMGLLPEGITAVKAVREYTSITLTLDRKFKDNWLGGLSYTWSRLYGNYSGLSNSDDDGRNSPNISRYFDNWFMAYNQEGEESLGLLRTDRTHQFKAYGAYAFDFGLTLGFNAYVMSGVPLQTELYLNGSREFYPLGRGSEGRTPWLWQIDLYAEYNLKLSEALTLQFNANITNLTDNDMARNRYMLYNGGVVYISEWDIKNGFDYAQVIADKGAQPDGLYNMEYDYLEAIAARLGIKLMF